MKKVKIISTDGYFGHDCTDEFAKFGLKIGDEIDVRPFVTNPYVYQPIEQGDVLFIYKHQVEDVLEDIVIKFNKGE